MSGGINTSQRTTLRTKGSSFNYDGILSPLNLDRGVVFPYTPVINIGHSANFGQYDITHGIYQPNFYVNTPNPQIDMTCTFTAQDITEAEHTVACLHFFKAVTKGDFGEASRATTAGTPPPVLLFSTYGSATAQNVPVVLRSFNYTLPDDFDYVTVETAAGPQTIPTQMMVAISLIPQYAPTKVRKNFNIQDYRSGRAGGFM
jgi:hypothetical protein